MKAWHGLELLRARAETTWATKPRMATRSVKRGRNEIPLLRFGLPYDSQPRARVGTEYTSPSGPGIIDTLLVRKGRALVDFLSRDATDFELKFDFPHTLREGGTRVLSSKSGRFNSTIPA